MVVHQNKSLNEESPFDPKKALMLPPKFLHTTSQKIYRDSYDMFCTNGILFNHESPYRGETFVTRKITRAVGRISLDLQSKLTLGNLEASRDWGFAGDYVDAMWKIMQHEEPSDWVIATGETQTVKDFAKLALEEVNLNWEDYVETSEKYFRPK